MARKSAAQAKVKKVEKAEEPKSAEEIMKMMKDPMIVQLKAQIIMANRVDNMANLRDLYKNFYGEYPNFKELKAMLELSIKTYEKILERFEGIDVVFLSKEELPDLFEDMIKKARKVTSDEDLLSELVVYLSVNPYANKLIQMHQLFREEMEKGAR